MSDLLTVDSLEVSIDGARILDGVSLKVGAGEILGLVGASGSGKSMTALSILRLLPAGARASGTVTLADRSLTAMTDAQMREVRGSQIGIVFQEPSTALNPLMRIGDQVAETVTLHRRVARSEARALAREAFDRVGLRADQAGLERYPHELSGGQRQRVAIAMAVILSPPLLIADEPTTALDAAAQAEIMALLRGLAHSRDMGLILVSHDLGVIARITDRIAVMHQGKIVEELASHALLASSRHPYTRSLIAASKLERKRTAPPAHDAQRVLEARDIVREYTRPRRFFGERPAPLRAVDGVSLILHAGETVGLVGESGSGKSSFLRTLLALDTPQAGEVLLLGEDFTIADGVALKRLRRSIQVVLQDPYGSFDPRWSVERLVAEPYYLSASAPPAAQVKKNVAAALEEVGLSAADAVRYPHEFSGGQRQRIAIARALILKPAVIAFDEAVSALDVLVRAQILELLAELAQRLKLAYLFVSHDLAVVRSIADRVYVMRHGRIVEEGATEAVFASPQHPYTKLLLEAAPLIR